MDTPGLHVLLVSNLPVGAVRTSAAVPTTQRVGPNAVLFLLAAGTAVTVAPAPAADIAFDLAGHSSSVGGGGGGAPAFRVWCPLGAAGYLGNAAAAPLPVEIEGRRYVLVRGQGLPVAAATVRIPLHGGDEGGPLLGRYFVSPGVPRATLAEAYQVVGLLPPPPPPKGEEEDEEGEEEGEGEGGEDPDIEMQDAGEETDETSRERPCHGRHRHHHHRRRQQQPHRKENAEPERRRKHWAAAHAARRERETSRPQKRAKGWARRRPRIDSGDGESSSDTERKDATAAADADADEDESAEASESAGGAENAEPTCQTGEGGAFGGSAGYGAGAMPAWLGALGKGIRLKGLVDIIPLTATDE